MTTQSQSGAIRRRAGPMIAAFNAALKRVKIPVSLFDETDSGQEKLDKLANNRLVITNDLHSLQKYITNCDELDKDWNKIVETCPEEIQAAELEMYQTTAVEGYLVLKYQAMDKISALEFKLAEIGHYMDQLKTPSVSHARQQVSTTVPVLVSSPPQISSASNNAAMAPISNVTGSQRSANTHSGMTSYTSSTGAAFMGTPEHTFAQPLTFKLGRDDVPEFDGNELNWNEFYETFKTLVHENPAVPILQKFRMLKDKLKGSAEVVLACNKVSSNPTAYDLAYSKVIDRYHNTEKLKFALYERLEQMESAKSRGTQILAKIDEIESILGQLMILGEDYTVSASKAALIRSIFRKVPKNVIHDADRYMPADGWDIQSLLRALRAVGQTRDRVDTYAPTTGDNGKKKQHKAQKGKHDAHDEFNATVFTLQNETESQQRKSQKHDNMKQKHKSSNFTNTKPTNSRNTHMTTKACVFCGEPHWSDQCRKVLTVKDRHQALKKAGRCFQCLDVGHMTNACTSNKACFHCKKMGHHMAVCFALSDEQKQTRGNKDTTTSQNSASNVKQLVESSDSEDEPLHEPTTYEMETPVKTLDGLDNDERVIVHKATDSCTQSRRSALMTVPVMVYCKDHPARTQRVWATIDSCSEHSFVSSQLAQKLKMRKFARQNMRVLAFGSGEAQKFKTSHTTFEMKSVIAGEQQKLEVTAKVVPKAAIGHKQIRPKLTEADLDVIKRLRLEGLQCDEMEVSPDILIGSEFFGDVVTQNVTKLPSGLTVIGTIFGPIAIGKPAHAMIKQENDSSNVLNVITLSVIEEKEDNELCVTNNEEALRTQVENLFQKENEHDELKQNDDEKAQQRFDETVTRTEEGRPEVTWPFKDNLNQLPTNETGARRRFKQNSKKFVKRPAIYQSVVDVISAQEKLDIIEKAPDEPDGPIHVLPLTIVTRPDKETTKTRVCLDAGAREKPDDLALNDVILRGDSSMPDTPQLMTNFRLKKYAVSSDLEKAFLQMQLRPDQRDVARFMWYKDVSKPWDTSPENTCIMRFKRVPFGIIASPGLLRSTIRYACDSKKHDLAQLIKNHIYVDNCLVGFDTQEEVQQFYAFSKSFFKEYRMNLREFASNWEDFVETLPEEDQAKGKTQKILGLKWSLEDDVLTVRNALIKYEDVPTKSDVLKTIASVYDSQGFMLPLLSRAKVFFQKLIARKLHWDEQIPTDLHSEWNDIISDLNELDTIRIKRWIQAGKAKKHELHVFADASDTGGGSAAYLCSTNDDGVIQSHLIQAKHKLAPLNKASTTPRLELDALEMGARLMKSIRANIDIEIPDENCYVWSDSQVALCWLKSEKKLPVYVQNRVTKIRKINASFRYVPTKLNPADKITRKMTLPEMQMPEHMWWKGPEFLTKPQEDWPTCEVPPFTTDDLVQMAKPPKPSQVIQLKINEESEDKDSSLPFAKFSKLTKLQKTVVYMMRFLKKCTRKITRFKDVTGLDTCSVIRKSIVHARDDGPVQAEEMIAAQQIIDRQHQQTSMAELCDSMEKGYKHPLASQMNLIMKSDGLIRVKARLENADLTAAAKEPILVNKNTTYAALIIRSVHEKLQHVGVKHTLNEVRERWWILNGRSQVTKVLHDCNLCRKLFGGPYSTPNAAPLPTNRVTKAEPFERIGIDFFGPINVKESTERKKAWGVIFTCLTTRNIWLDYLLDMTTEAFLASFRRMMAIFGKPRHIYCDNAKQFVLAEKVMSVKQDICGPELMDYCSQETIQWHFITPLAPWQSGHFERLIGITKRNLKAAVGRKLLTVEQLRTLLPETAAIVNSRPLTFVYSDANSMEVLRPVDFFAPKRLIGSPALNEADEKDDPTFTTNLSSAEKLREIWAQNQMVLDKFWQLWKQEYLAILRERTQMKMAQSHVTSHWNPTLGQIVHVHEELPRALWKMGKVVKLFRTKDDQEIRAVEVQLANGTKLKRPLSLLYPIECSEGKKSEDRHQNKIDEEIGDESDDSTTNTNEDVSKEDKKKEQTTNEGNVRRSPRLNPKLFAMNTVLMMVTIAGLFVSTADAVAIGECHKQHQKIVVSEHCVSSGYIVYETEEGNLCWMLKNCPEAMQLAETGKCLPHCGCEPWADNCVHVSNRDKRYELTVDQRMALARAEPQVCSFEPDRRCENTPTKKEIPVVQLHDGTKHKVKQLTVTVEETIPGQYDCIGDDSEGKVTGRVEYCAKHQCADRAKYLCFFRHVNKAFFVAESGVKVPIVAWGHEMIDVYTAKKEKTRQIDFCVDCAIECTKTGVNIHGVEEASLMQICSPPTCYTKEFPNQIERFAFSPEIQMHEHEVSAKLWRKGVIVSDITVVCEGHTFCENIECTWCLLMITNYQCYPNTVIMMVLFATACAAAILYYTSRVLSGFCKVGYSCVKCWYICCKKVCHRSSTTVYRHVYLPIRNADGNNEDDAVVIDIEGQEVERSPNYRYAHSESFRRIRGQNTRVVLSAVCLMVIIGLPVSQVLACSETATVITDADDCERHGNETTCILQTTADVMLVPENQETCLMIKSPQRPLATLKIQTVSMSLRCQHKTMFYSRSFDMKVSSVKRCPSRGWCTGTKCEDTKVDTLVNDIGKTANSKPGYTYCASSGSCWSNSCFLCSDACLWWRVYAVTASDNVFEIFECPVWDIVALTKVTLATETNETTEELELVTGMSQEIHGAVVTLKTTSLPPIPILGKQFITDGKRVVVTDIAGQNQMIPGSPSSLRCPTKQSAQNFTNCELGIDTCKCTTRPSATGCVCKNVHLEELYEQEENLLPIHNEVIDLIPADGTTVKAQMNAFTSAEVAVKFKGTKIKLLESERQKCFMKIRQVTGCYNCLTGARVEYQCRSSKEKTLAHVTCGKKHMSVRCTPEGYKGVTRLTHDKAKLTENCVVSCSGGTTEAQLNGTLHFVPTKLLGKTANVIASKKVEDKFDFWQMFDVSTYWHMTVIGGMIVLLMVVATTACMCVPILMPWIIQFTIWNCRKAFAKMKKN